MEKPLLIVGIDPGTTVGYAMLDVEGRLLVTDSAKEISIGDLISKVIEKGKPILVGCDKKKTPQFVDKFKTKVGAKVVSPKEDMKYKEKRNMTKLFPFKNKHQMDAIASALYAWKSEIKK